MIRHRVLPAWRQSYNAYRIRLLRPQYRTQSTEARASRLDRLTSKLPRRLQKYTNGLRNAPVSHIISFLILHEITAIAPLFGLFALFHYTNHVPVTYMTDHFGEYVQSGVSRFERYFQRKGWFGFRQEDNVGHKSQTEEAVQRWHSGEQKYRILVEVALAYAVTKALLPIRIIGSVWATPWFAGILVKLRSSLSRK
ncbi:hypothetical protein PT974_07152 [Cladobotryum mycophilum]|uniref:Uncharacterized protein n=1 Tax=Cladobotryum mycophilum TaxID=491253 RepID=A0ABR0SNH3_9HYPO